MTIGRRTKRWLTKALVCFLVIVPFYWMILYTLEDSHNLPTQHRLSSYFHNPFRSTKKKISNNINKCSHWFEDEFSDNLRIIENYPRGLADNYLPFVDGDLTAPLEMTSFPVIVTAANSLYYKMTEGLIESVHRILLPKYANLRIVYYDLGLTIDQRKTLERYCLCEVRTFPFHLFPTHVHYLKQYAWKPLIIHKSLMEFGAIWWLDSSVRFKTAELERAIDHARTHGILFFTYGPSLSVAQHTDTQTMQYLKEDVCKFRQFGETEATFGLYYWHNTTRVIVRSWAACALNSDCIAPPGTDAKLHCNPRIKTDGHCHRFDQAILSIMTRRLYHDKNEYPDVEEPFRIHDVRRGHSIDYFPDQNIP